MLFQSANLTLTPSCLLVCAQLGLRSDTCAFSPPGASPHASLSFHLNLVGSVCVLQTGLFPQALASDMPSELIGISYLLSSNSFPPLLSLFLSTEGKHSKVMDTRSIYVFVQNFGNLKYLFKYSESYLGDYNYEVILFLLHVIRSQFSTVNGLESSKK